MGIHLLTTELHRRVVGNTRYRVQSWVQRNTPKLAGYAQSLAKPALTVGKAGASLGSLIGGMFGGFVAVLLAIPTAGALQVLVKGVWQATAPDQLQESRRPRLSLRASTVTRLSTPTASDRPGQPGRTLVPNPGSG
jgi:hypothetical protein